MKKGLVLLLALAAGLTSYAQNHWCATDHYYAQQVANDPSISEERQKMVEQIHQGSAFAASRADEKIIVPTVFHIISNSCEGDISMAQIKDGLRILNEDLKRTNEDTALTRDVFKGVAASSNIEFRLAQIDPDGNPTDGVVRITSPQATNAGNGVKSLSYWPSNQYYNIWVVENIQNFTGGGGIILGYAQFPGSGSWNTYGTVIRNDAVGIIGTANSDGRTLTHEVGHTFNLYHTFQSGCGGSCNSSGDFICDTPPSAESTQSCNFSINTCSNDQAGSSPYNSNVPDMIENYMSYNSCQNMFTQGQSDVMISTLQQVSTLIDLTSEENLLATGVKGLIAADFDTDRKVACVNAPVQFKNQSSYDAQSVSWDFGGFAVPGTSTDFNPLVSFAEAGVYSISLDAMLSGQTKSIQSNEKVLIVDDMGHFIPFTDDLESQGFLPTNQWFPVNSDLDDYQWKLNTTAAASGSNSFMMENFGNCGETKDELITQSFDFSPFSKVDMSFKVAYAQRTGSENDFLRLYVSNDCGETWQLTWVQGGSALAGLTAPQNSPFTPLSPADWTEFNIPLQSPTLMVEGVIFKFEFNSQGGNNLYFDDFALTGDFNGEILLQSPFDGKQGLADTVTIDWKAVGGVDFYEYQIDKTPDFNSQDLISGQNAYINELPNNEDTEFKTPPLDLATQYFWRVRYVDGGQTSDWSETWSFNVSETGVGIGELSQAEVKVYPNPASDLVYLETTSVIQSSQLMDFSGRIVSNWTSEKQLNISEFEAGVYLLSIRTADGKVHTSQLVIR